ncbi:alanine racemase [Burkholderia ubonensis]|uniref:Amino acid decarboxylase n=1 Tax=Burkholderia ubonensis TaxID=101571 RepID=A0ABD6PUM6_9BURK|nr:alanine racemase [Burkholderia ubonensis]KVT40073.1 amino acid decarboxylase [Burkholderia ubonensis]KWO53754.1 amino acid decarboxylase [Burkholderia ubonensis]OJA37404.1 amino acid decarboxylase [Burkholderia ubonensis]
MVNRIARLPALWDPAQREFVDEHEAMIHELAHGFDAPLHLLFPERFARNVAAFQRVLDERRVAGRVYYAKKANKARCFVRAAADAEIGVDVASVGEFADALAAGVCGADIGVSGPAKAGDLLRLAVLHDALIAVDSLDELDRLATIARQCGGVARVLLRMEPVAQTKSRFGLSAAALDAALSVCASNRESLMLEGFSFHLSGYSAEARCVQAGIAVRACVQARALELSPHTINIGGGFAMSYASEDDWRAFQAAHGPDDYHAKKVFDGFYPYHQACSGAQMLDAILGGIPDGESKPLADLLREHGLQMMLEPGRALLDQAGFTVFTVQGVKDRGDHGIATVNGTSFSVSEQWFASEFLPDPELLTAARTSRQPPRASGPYRACVGGASCLDSDMLTWRKVAFAQRPEPGDLLLYPNTAGYQMDSNESPFHELPLPPKLVVTLDGARPRWRVDRLSPFSGA